MLQEPNKLNFMNRVCFQEQKSVSKTEIYCEEFK